MHHGACFGSVQSRTSAAEAVLLSETLLQGIHRAGAISEAAKQFVTEQLAGIGGHQGKQLSGLCMPEGER